ncbi:DTW domain-containing protein [Thalassotalea sp. LPB0316]|uniref:tRNA-uridine aminocarboxypropyltransferase n=1 Tax=Thalassotalea sp. LPB0316 TaxID=2769490 RepID=UPI0018665FCB|nr:DTW domain-containing protein [Thalassotalea sp. LPB0316]QOL25308.1 DTW domain-containing protein [Thalassotalea sp. LPB0316]
MNPYQTLYQQRIAQSTKPFNARGKGVKRCLYCQVAKVNCICGLKVNHSANAGFVLLLHDKEILKPSNTGRLINDVCDDFFPFIWSRTEPDQVLLDLLSDPSWYPMVVFPAQYAQANQQVITSKVELAAQQRPLFILLDGSWREARRMFRKSPYLSGLPLVTLPETQGTDSTDSRFALRSAQIDNHLATAEVAAKVLAQQGEHLTAALLDLWFDVFSWQYQKSVCQTAVGSATCLTDYREFVQVQGLTYCEK